MDMIYVTVKKNRMGDVSAEKHVYYFDESTKQWYAARSEEFRGIARIEGLLRKLGLLKIANILGRYDERNLGR